MSKNIRVFIADDHPVVRSGLKAALSGLDGLEVVGEADNGLETEIRVLESAPDVVIMDIYMPKMDGLKSLLAIKQKMPKVKVILLTISENEEHILQAFQLGADGYLIKNTGIEEVASAIKKVVKGEVVVSPIAASQFVKGLRKPQESEPPISKREEDVLRLVGEGLTNAEIANKLFLSPNTVSSYVHRLLRKLNLKSRAALVAYAVQHRK